MKGLKNLRNTKDTNHTAAKPKRHTPTPYVYTPAAVRGAIKRGVKSVKMFLPGSGILKQYTKANVAKANSDYSKAMKQLGW